jgi:hypothetical protein
MLFGKPDKDKVLPSHTGLLFDAIGIGNVFTVTEVVVVFEHPLLFVTVNEYVPDIAVVALPDTVGFCDVEVKPFGPDQE